MAKKHKIAPEVKADILRRVKEEGVPVAQAAKDHGVSENTIYSWLGGAAKGRFPVVMEKFWALRARAPTSHPSPPHACHSPRPVPSEACRAKAT
jgi:transposase-like protein